MRTNSGTLRYVIAAGGRLLLFAWLLILPGCGGGGGGAGSTTPTAPTSTASLTKAATAYNSGDINAAIAEFNGVLLSGADSTTQARAREGLGFSYLQANDTTNALKNLAEAAGVSADAAVAWSGTLLSSAGNSELSRSCERLIQTLDDSLPFGEGVISSGILPSQGQALGALLLSLRGQADDLARIQRYRTSAQSGSRDRRTARMLEALRLLTE